MTRKLCDPIMQPLERRVARFGGNPQDAPIWLVGIEVVLGLLLMGFVSWVAGIVYRVEALAHGGPGEWSRFVIDLSYFILCAALLVRVLGSWLGMGRYNRWMRLVYGLTDWLVEPIRRLLPPFGFIDLSPLIAYFALKLVHWLLITTLWRSA